MGNIEHDPFECACQECRIQRHLWAMSERAAIEEQRHADIAIRVIDFKGGFEWESRPPLKWLDDEDIEPFMEAAFGGIRFGEVFSWYLNHGVVPGDICVLRVFEPHTYRCSYEYDEYDTDYNAEFLSWHRVEKSQERRSAMALAECHSFLSERDKLSRKRNRFKNDVLAKRSKWLIQVEALHELYSDGWPGAYKGSFARLYSSLPGRPWIHRVDVTVREHNVQTPREGNSLAYEHLFTELKDRFKGLDRKSFERIPLRKH